MQSRANDIDEYLAAVPADARGTLDELRRTIREVAPGAVESISYGMPTFKYKGRPLVYFAASKKHCAIYGFDVETYRAELAGYDATRGTIRFTPDKPLPEDLVRRLLRERIEEIDAEAKK